MPAGIGYCLIVSAVLKCQRRAVEHSAQRVFVPLLCGGGNDCWRSLALGLGVLGMQRRRRNADRTQKDGSSGNHRMSSTESLAG